MPPEFRHVRQPENGCPWDIEQNFKTIAPYTIEEAYEVADAIERGNWDDLKNGLKTNKVDFLIEVQDIDYSLKSTYRIDLYKDFYLYSGLLSTVKSNNKLVNTLASIYAEENDLAVLLITREDKGYVKTFSSRMRPFILN